MLDGLTEGLKAGGGEVEGIYVLPGEAGLSELEKIEALMESADAAVSFFSGEVAKQFAQIISHSSKLDFSKFYFSKYFLDGLEKANIKTSEMKNFGCWDADDTQSAAFKSGYAELYGKYPNDFSLLGYENGQILASILAKNPGRSDQIVEVIQEFEFEGPRGTVKFESELNKTIYNHHLRLFGNEEGEIKNSEIQLLTGNKEMIKNVFYQGEMYSVNGWKTPYFCL